MTNSDDCQKLVLRLRDLAPRIEKSTDRAWSRNPASRVIDCVLSLNRNYDHFVVPRLDGFEAKYGEVRSVSDLKCLIDRFPSPFQFSVAALDYKDERRANILSQVIDWLVGISGYGSCDEQLERLKKWAQDADPADHLSLHIRGFALAGFQYLRMLFGANTIKPDVQICRFVKGAIGHPISAVNSLKLLETASPEAGIFSLRDLDTTIWESSARTPQGKSRNKSPCKSATTAK